MVECLDLRPDQPRPQGAFSLALEVGLEKSCLRTDVSFFFNRRRLHAGKEKGYATRKLRCG